MQYHAVLCNTTQNNAKQCNNNAIWARPWRLIQCPVVGRLVVAARWLYLARHLFTLYVIYFQYPGKEYSPRTTATNQPTFSLIHFSGCGHNMFRVQNGPFFGPKVWVVGYKLQPYWTTGELGWRSDWELKVNVVEHTGNQHRVTGVRVGLVIDSGSVLAPGILLWPDSKANIIAQSIPPFCISFIDKNTNNAGIANAV